MRCLHVISIVQKVDPVPANAFAMHTKYSLQSTISSCLVLGAPLLDSLLEVSNALLHGVELHVASHAKVVVAVLLDQSLNPLFLALTLLSGRLLDGS